MAVAGADVERERQPRESPRPRLPRLRLRGLMILTAVLALTFAAARVHPILALPVLATALLAASGPPREPGAGPWYGALLVLLVVGIPAEWAASVVAEETLGEIDAGLRLLATFANVVAVVLYAVGLRRSALALAAVILIAVVPDQVVLGHRWALLKDEVSRIVTYAYASRLSTGDFPADLSGYRFRHPELARHFAYERDPRTRQFRVTYFVGTEGTSHWYNSADGPAQGWGYYPD